MKHAFRKTFFNYSASKSFFKQQIEKIIMMTNFETMLYKSPTGWMFVLNYHKIECCLEKYQMDMFKCYRDYVCNLIQLDYV